MDDTGDTKPVGGDTTATSTLPTIPSRLNVLQGNVMDNALLETVANQFVESYGPAALSVLQQRADVSEELGHRVAAKTWREIAAAVRMRVGDC